MKPHVAIRRFADALREWNVAREEMRFLDDTLHEDMTDEVALGHLQNACMHMGTATELVRSLLNASKEHGND